MTREEAFELEAGDQVIGRAVADAGDHAGQHAYPGQ